jgi:plastocyanin
MKCSKFSWLVILSLVTVMLVLGACSSSPAPAATSAPPSSSAPAPATSSVPPATTPPVPSSPAAGPAVTINLISQNMSFDQNTLTVPAGAKVTMNFNNKDSIPHNFALYTDSSAATVIFKGDIVSSKSIVYQFTAPAAPGTYFFRCDVHPTTMTGTFKVQ